jgi:hypothetical protein
VPEKMLIILELNQELGQMNENIDIRPLNLGVRVFRFDWCVFVVFRGHNTTCYLERSIIVLNKAKSHLDGRHDGFFDQQGHLRLEHAGHLDGIGLDVELLQLHRVFLASAGAPLERGGAGACFPGAASQRRYKGGPRPRGWHGLRTHREMRNETSLPALGLRSWSQSRKRVMLSLLIVNLSEFMLQLFITVYTFILHFDGLEYLFSVSGVAS